MPRERIAIIGAGVSGLGAAWALARDHDVRVFERADRVGGHTRVAARNGAGALNRAAAGPGGAR